MTAADREAVAKVRVSAVARDDGVVFGTSNGLPPPPGRRW
jgi:hypothetical protein